MANQVNRLPAQKLDDAQEEERLEDQLDYLNALHVQLRSLRDVLPRVIAPLASSHTSRKEMYEAFIKTMESTKREMQDFQKAYTSDESRAVFASASQSRKANPAGIFPWRAKNDPNWTTLKRKRAASDVGN